MIHFHEATGFSPIRITKENTEKFIDKKLQRMTTISSFVNVLFDLDEEIQENIYSITTGKKSTDKKSKGEKGNKFDPFGSDEKNKFVSKNKVSSLSEHKKQQIFRAFVEFAVMVPALAREQDVTLEEFEFWDQFGFNYVGNHFAIKELFFDVYHGSWQFKDRIDTIYGLCEDVDYLVDNYIDRLVS